MWLELSLINKSFTVGNASHDRKHFGVMRGVIHSMMATAHPATKISLWH